MREFLSKVIKFFRVINIYHSKNNNRKILFKNLELKKYISIKEVKSKKIKEYLKRRNIINRFLQGCVLFALKKGKIVIGLGWKSENSLYWHISEIDKYFFAKNRIILFDFWVFKEYRKKSYYSKMLLLIKNQITNKKFIIYSLITNKNSIKGILKAGFKFDRKISKFND